MMREAVKASMEAGFEGKLTLVSVDNYHTLSFYYDTIGLKELKGGVMQELVLSPENAKAFMERSVRSAMGEINWTRGDVAMVETGRMEREIRTDEEIWAEFLELVESRNNATSEEEKKAIMLAYQKKHGITDPDDDRVMMAGVLPDEDTLSRLKEEMFGPELKTKS